MYSIVLSYPNPDRKSSNKAPPPKKRESSKLLTAQVHGLRHSSHETSDLCRRTHDHPIRGSAEGRYSLLRQPFGGPPEHDRMKCRTLLWKTNAYIFSTQRYMVQYCLLYLRRQHAKNQGTTEKRHAEQNERKASITDIKKKKIHGFILTTTLAPTHPARFAQQQQWRRREHPNNTKKAEARHRRNRCTPGSLSKPSPNYAVLMCEKPAQKLTVTDTAPPPSQKGTASGSLLYNRWDFAASHACASPFSRLLRRKNASTAEAGQAGHHRVGSGKSSLIQ